MQRVVVNRHPRHRTNRSWTRLLVVPCSCWCCCWCYPYKPRLSGGTSVTNVVHKCGEPCTDSNTLDAQTDSFFWSCLYLRTDDGTIFAWFEMWIIWIWSPPQRPHNSTTCTPHRTLFYHHAHCCVPPSQPNTKQRTQVSSSLLSVGRDGFSVGFWKKGGPSNQSTVVRRWLPPSPAAVRGCVVILLHPSLIDVSE